MYFGKPMAIQYQPTLNGNPIEWVSSWKYLGVTLKNGRRFNCSVSERIKAFYRSLNSILRVEGRSNDIVLLRLLEAHCVPIITYAIETIHVMDQDEKRSLRVAYNSILAIGVSKVYLISSTLWVDPHGKSWLIDAKVVFSRGHDLVTTTH